MAVFSEEIVGKGITHTKFPADMLLASECPHRPLNWLSHTQQHHEVRGVVDEDCYYVDSADVVRPLLIYHVVGKELEENANDDELADVGKIDEGLKVCSSQRGDVRCRELLPKTV